MQPRGGSRTKLLFFECVLYIHRFCFRLFFARCFPVFPCFRRFFYPTSRHPTPIMSTQRQTGGCACGGCGHSLTQPNSLALNVQRGGGRRRRAGAHSRAPPRGTRRRVAMSSSSMFQIRCRNCGTSISNSVMNRIRQSVKASLRSDPSRRHRRRGRGPQRGGSGLTFTDAMRGLFGGVGPSTIGTYSIITGQSPPSDLVTNPPSLSTNRTQYA